MKVLDVQEGKGTIEGGRPVSATSWADSPILDAAFPINDPSPWGDLGDRVGRQARQRYRGLGGRLEVRDRSDPRRQAALDLRPVPRRDRPVAAQAADDHLAGKAVAKDIKIPVKLITPRANAEDGDGRSLTASPSGWRLASSHGVCSMSRWKLALVASALAASLPSVRIEGRWAA